MAYEEGLTEKEVCRLTRTTVIPTNNDIMNEGTPHHSYSTAYGPSGDPINFAIRYDNSGLSDLIIMDQTLTANNPMLYITTFMMLQTRGTIIGKDNDGAIYSRQREGCAMLVGAMGSEIVRLFIMPPAVARNFGVTGY